MKKNMLLVLIFLSLNLLGMQGQNKTQLKDYSTGKEWLKKAIFYQIYPSTFQDSDGDGIGDIKGIISRLDYVKSLGVNTIWFNPLFSSNFQDGGYDITDFYSVDKRYGTNDDMVKLIGEIHKRGMKICMDLVAGHTSDKCEWFKKSMEGTNNQYSDYYIWTNRIPDEANNVQIDLDRGILAKESYVKLQTKRGNYYVKNFFDCQPALNYGYANPNPNNPWEQSPDAPGPKAVRREIKNIIAFWMDKGVDGFRVDLASSIVKNDPDKFAAIKVWQEISSWFKQSYPDGFLVSEWSNPKESFAGGFDIDFMMHAGKYNYSSLFFNRDAGEGKPKSCYFDLKGEGELKTWYNLYIEQYAATKGKGYISFPTGNHDFQRLNCDSRNTTDQLKVAMTFFLTMPGIPFIYYGDEIGMKHILDLPNVEGSHIGNYKRTGNRTPMQWDQSKNAGFSISDKLYIPIDPSHDRPTVWNENREDNSLLNYTRILINLRQTIDALGNDGDWALLTELDKPYPMVYLRSTDKEKYLVVLNPTSKDQSIDLSKHQIKKLSILVGNSKQISFKANIIKIKAVSAVIYKIEP